MIVFQKRYKLADLDAVADAFLPIAQPYSVWALSGQLGAGKTTFTTALLKAMGSGDQVSSPTFSIINIYQAAKQKVYHSDWYRIGDEEEAIAAGIEDMLEQDGVKIVEWWERAADLLPEDTIYVYINVLSAEEREIVCSTAVI
jgi:tRNA threonylcarbamoyladenosine biosynthesis protein TsaE